MTPCVGTRSPFLQVHSQPPKLRLSSLSPFSLLSDSPTPCMSWTFLNFKDQGPTSFVCLHPGPRPWEILVFYLPPPSPAARALLLRPADMQARFPLRERPSWLVPAGRAAPAALQ